MEAQLDDFSLSLRRERAVQALLPLFFVSGATGLAYQTIWARELHLVFGTSTFAISTVLTAFMGGMALGGALMARWADRVTSPLRTYGWLEIAIGLYALAFPVLLRLVTPVYLSAWRTLEPSPVVFGAIQLVLVGSTLVVPTAAMGATLPVLARFATERLGAAGDRVGTLYGVNTAGAVFGTWLCGFVLLPQLGLWNTTLGAAGANLALGAGAIALAAWSRGAERARATDDLEEHVADGAWVPVAVAMGLAGFASLVYEVAWTRLLGLMLGASVYAFTLMLLAFLVGIAVGGKLGGGLADRVLDRSGLRGVLWTLAGIEVGVAFLSWAMMYLYPELPFWYVWLFDTLGGSSEPTWMWVVSFALSVLIMTPPAVLMGVAFPVAVRAVVTRPDALGGPVGRVYAANTLGSMLGAALAGFVLLPLLQVQGTIFLAACTNLAAAALVVVWATRARRDEGVRARQRVVALGALAGGVGLLALVAGRPPWNPLLMTAGMYKYVTSFSDHSREGILDYSVAQYDLLYYEEGLSTVVTVAKNKDSGNIWLANNGKVEASTTVDMPTQVLVTLLPFQFTPDPERALVIGLASGITAGAATLVDDLEQIDVVELEPAILRAAPFFDGHNFGVLHDPRVDLILNDGRNHILLTPPHTYDVIVAEPSNPWITGVSNLFTREFFEMGKERLVPGGVWSQWVQLYGMDEKDMRTLLATFAAVYPHVLVYATVEDADLVLIGSDRPLLPAPELVEHAWRRWPRVGEAYRDVGMRDPMEVVSTFQMDRPAITRLVDEAPLNTDDNMRIEYRAPKNLHRSTQLHNYKVLIEHAVPPLEALGPHPRKAAVLARRYWEREDGVRAISTMAAAAYMTDDLELRDALLTEAEAWQAELIEFFDAQEKVEDAERRSGR